MKKKYFGILFFIVLLMSACGKSGSSSMNVVDVENYIIGEWSDPSCYMVFDKDKRFEMRKKSSYNSSVEELKGEYEIVSSKALILYIDEGKYMGQTVYPKQLSAGAKILSLNTAKKELYIKCFVDKRDFIVAKLKKK